MPLHRDSGTLACQRECLACVCRKSAPSLLFLLASSFQLLVPPVQIGFTPAMLLLSPQKQGNLHASLKRAAAAAADALERQVSWHLSAHLFMLPPLYSLRLSHR